MAKSLSDGTSYPTFERAALSDDEVQATEHSSTSMARNAADGSLANTGALPQDEGGKRLRSSGDGSTCLGSGPSTNPPDKEHAFPYRICDDTSRLWRLCAAHLRTYISDNTWFEKQRT